MQFLIFSCHICYTNQILFCTCPHVTQTNILCSVHISMFHQPVLFVLCLFTCVTSAGTIFSAFCVTSVNPLYSLLTLMLHQPILCSCSCVKSTSVLCSYFPVTSACTMFFTFFPCYINRCLVFFGCSLCHLSPSASLTSL